MRLSDFDFHLPAELIAQKPLDDRAASRMLVVHRDEARLEDLHFRDLPKFLRQGDCLVLNDSRVIPARLYGHREGHTGKVEALLVRPVSPDNRTWLALMRPGRKLRTGERIHFGPGFIATIEGRSQHGERLLRFETASIWDALNQHGHIPLPPYIHREDSPDDRARYQTVYAAQPGSVAAPTAGLHFTPQVLSECESAGAQIARVTLHVGLGTFQPLHTEDLSSVQLHAERFEVTPETESAIRSAARIIPIGTTALRTVESLMQGAQGETSLFISPGYHFQRTNALLTNFHLPKSSLFILVCALAGTDLMKIAYQHAIERDYRFYSYGDCMLIL